MSRYIRQSPDLCGRIKKWNSFPLYEQNRAQITNDEERRVFFQNFNNNRYDSWGDKHIKIVFLLRLNIY